MQITDFSIRRIDPSDPRFPSDSRGHDAVFLCEMQTDAGPREVPLFTKGTLTRESVANMLRFMAKAVEEAK